jgi:hypothetical protein
VSAATIVPIRRCRVSATVASGTGIPVAVFPFSSTTARNFIAVPNPGLPRPVSIR